MLIVLGSTVTVFGCNCERVALLSAYNMYVGAEPDGRANAKRAVQENLVTWTIERKGKSNKVAFRSYHGKYLKAEENGQINANGEFGGTLHTFVVEEHENLFTLRTHHGTYLSGDSFGNLSTQIEVRVNERFVVKCVAG